MFQYSSEILHRIKFFIKYILLRQGRHDIHSPFIYKFLENVLLAAGEPLKGLHIEQYRQQCKLDRQGFNRLDYGAGSITGHVKHERINAIASKALQSRTVAALLYRIAKWHQPERIIELGTSLGVTTMYLASAGFPTVSVEGDPVLASYAERSLKKMELYADIKQGTFSQIIPQILKSGKKKLFIYIDGNHTYEGTLENYLMFLKSMDEGSVVIIDDIYWSSEMTRAWQWLKERPEVGYTIDLYKIGILFCQPVQVKQHFTLKYR